jgi:HSP20 family protein
MTLIKRNFPGFGSLTNFFNDDWFDKRFESWSPAVNVAESDLNYEIEVAAPGIKKEDFDVSVENGILSIVGKSEKEHEEKEKNYTRREFSSQSFQRRFPVPEDADPEMVEAKHEDGVLHITLHKRTADQRPKKGVEVK